jgi:hypothetical protein
MRSLRITVGLRTVRAARPRRRPSRRGAAGAAVLALSAALAAPASAAAQPTGPYAGMGTCPLAGSALQSPSNGSVGCVVATVNGGSFEVGGVTVALPAGSPLTVKFGVYWPAGGPTETFPDGNEVDVFSTVAPTDGQELTGDPIDVPIPGLSNYFPGVTSAITQVQLAGPITGFAPLSTGENSPLFDLPIKLHLLNAFLGLSCYVGGTTDPILLKPTAGTTSPPRPNTPITGNSGTVSLAGDPNGFGDAIVGFSGASLVDNAFSVPAASGCGLGGSLDWLVDLLFGLSSPAGHNTLTFGDVTTTFAVDTSVSDLTSAIKASE